MSFVGQIPKDYSVSYLVEHKRIILDELLLIEKELADDWFDARTSYLKEYIKLLENYRQLTDKRRQAKMN